MDNYLAVFEVFFVLFLVLLSTLKTKRVFNPISILLVYWGGTLILSIYSLTGLFSPSLSTHFLMLVMMFSVTLGALFVRPLPSHIVNNNKVQLTKEKAMFSTQAVAKPATEEQTVEDSPNRDKRRFRFFGRKNK